VSRAHRIARALRAGVVYVNCYDADDITVPFGGFKQSGTGATSRCTPSTSTPSSRPPGSTVVTGYRNLTFDELEVGATASAKRALTQTEIEALVLVSGDVEPFHQSRTARCRRRRCSRWTPSA